VRRSIINEIIRRADGFLRSHAVVLPPFAYWSGEMIRGEAGALIRERRLGWDITDYGQNRFGELGLFLFTLRNGPKEDMAAGKGELYAEKVMISCRDQVAPTHRHVVKTEDLINIGGGDLVIELNASAPDGSIDRETPVRVLSDAVRVDLDAGGRLRLKPGQSVTIRPGTWHAFWAERNDCLIREISTVNDDLTDNVFAQDLGRFSEVEEDEEPLRLLVSDY